MSNSMYESSKELISGEEMVCDGRPSKEFTFENRKENSKMHRVRPLLYTLYTPLKLAGTENTSIRLDSFFQISLRLLTPFCLLVRENKLSCYFKIRGIDGRRFIVHCSL